MNGAWISTKDALPERDQVVLVIVDGKPKENITLVGAYFLAEYAEGEGWIIDGHEAWTTGFEVTHWRKLPELPRKEGNQNENN